MAEEQPVRADQFDERYWANYRADARRRAALQMGLPIGALISLVALMKLIGGEQYPAGDLRNAIEFKLLFYGAFILFGTALAIRGLFAVLEERRNRR